MGISPQGKKFIQQLEGCELEAYPDCVGVWTIGYGSTFYKDGTPVQQGDVISLTMANDLFDEVIERFSKTVTKAVALKSLEQHEKDSLISFCYNVGEQAFKTSSVLRAVLHEDKAHVVRAFFNWVTPVSLLNRRRNEADLYLKGDYTV